MCHSIQNWLFGSNSFFDLCYSMLPLFVKDDLVMAAVATTVLHALICKTCLNISSTKDDQLWDRAKTTLVCVMTIENYRWYAMTPCYTGYLNNVED